MKAGLVIPALVILGAAALSSVYVVDQREKVLVQQFGEVVRVVEEPGLYFKLSLVQDVTRYSNQIQGLVTPPQEINFSDRRRLVVDAFARWRIVDVQKFREAVGLGGIESAGASLGRIVNSEVRDVLGDVPLSTVLSPERVALMAKIRDAARAKAQSLGIEVIDVRLTRTDLPVQNLQNTYSRMEAERNREATDEIARGNEAAQKIRATANRQAAEITAEANKKAAIVRGEADARRAAIYAEAYGQDPEFYAFYRSLQAYATALQGGNTSFVLAPEGDFFRFFGAGDASGSVGADGTGAMGVGTTVNGGAGPKPPEGSSAAP
ncbi:protease modulator HflC [Stagnihabitans tardus]|uniref:Protein HflC n=1 Tax=Stagnihabitans tardus TaxID=2699202 RepID=A0AAE4YB78_9RHOB|nr:protease modulator HflC [Stagnihabitans tardus]NBZ89461.1 protease modulator HflC [Stagnihabitans tardus]